jgi:hypothetical protein
MMLPFIPVPTYPKDAKRRFFIGGSDARIIMGQDQDALLRQWREKRGERSRSITRTISSCSSGWLPSPSTGSGSCDRPDRPSTTSRAGFGIR